MPPTPPRPPGQSAVDPESHAVRARPHLVPPPLSSHPSAQELAMKYADAVGGVTQRVNQLGDDLADFGTRALMGISDLTREVRGLKEQIAPGGAVEQRAAQASRPAVEEIKAAVVEAVEEITGEHDVVTPNTLELTLMRRDLAAKTAQHSELTKDEKDARARRAAAAWTAVFALLLFILERAVEWAAKGHP